MLATGMGQRAVATALGISQPAVSQQAKAAVAIGAETLIEAAAPVLKGPGLRARVHRPGRLRLSCAGQSRPDSDIDPLVRPPTGAAIGDLLDLQEPFERVLGRQVDVVSYGGPKAGIDDDVLRDVVVL